MTMHKNSRVSKLKSVQMLFSIFRVWEMRSMKWKRIFEGWHNLLFDRDNDMNICKHLIFVECPFNQLNDSFIFHFHFLLSFMVFRFYWLIKYWSLVLIKNRKDRGFFWSPILTVIAIILMGLFTYVEIKTWLRNVISQKRNPRKMLPIGQTTRSGRTKSLLNFVP